MYEKAIVADPSNAWGYYNLGTAQQALARYPEAQQAYYDAIRLNSSIQWAWYNLALVQKSTGNYTGYALNLKQAIALDPDLPKKVGLS